MQNIKYIIVQAGGKGSRMEKLTVNKPKALVPVNNLPMIFHLFKKFPDKKFVVIGDYKYSVLEKYLKAFATVDYKMVNGNGRPGTCAGLKEAVEYIPENEPFMLIWCDLVLPEDYHLPELKDSNVIGISKDFVCRWMYKDGLFREERSDEYGVAGHFVFLNKSYLKDVPGEGEFVRWLSEQGMQFETQGLYRTHEYGLISEWEKLPKFKCRPFNKITIKGDRIIKEPVNDQGEELAEREISWYKAAKEAKCNILPEIYSYKPLTMEYIDGKNIYELSDLSLNEKKEILKTIITNLKSLHDYKQVDSDKESYDDAYIGKTLKRLEQVYDLVPFAKDEYVVINGKKCHNIFGNVDKVKAMVEKFFPKEFCFIHGDCTFSNMMIRSNNKPVLIDPRGYFGHIKLYGDPAYDWVKVYYSLVSNYDQFNLKNFDLKILEDQVTLDIKSNGWEELEDYFFELLKGEVTKEQMKLFLAITWLSLTTYAWEDYDSICGAFYNGLYYLEDVL